MKLECGAPPDLITVRRKKGVSLQDISEATKIGVNYLQAIEEGEFARLPGGIYSTSYIRQYARAIDYGESELLEHYYRATGLGPQATTAGREPNDRGDGSFTSMLRRVSRVHS